MSDRYVLLHGGALGDLALTLQLALRLPSVERTGLLVISRTDPGDLTACRPSIARRSSETVGLHWLFADDQHPAPATLLSLIAGQRVINALGGPDTSIHRRLLRLGPTALYSFDARARPDAERHISEQWRSQLEAQGLLIPKCIHQRQQQRGLGVPESLRAGGRTLLAAGRPVSSALASGQSSEGRQRVVLMHPGSGGRNKCWPLPHFVDLADALTAMDQTEVHFVVGPVELETWPGPTVEALGRRFALHSQLSADDLVALLSAVDVFVGNDAGPTHLAALLGTPTVAVFGPTSPTVWKPTGPVVRAVAAPGGWPSRQEVENVVRELL